MAFAAPISAIRLSLLLLAAGMGACATQQPADAEICAVLGGLRQSFEGGETPPASAFLNTTNLGNRRIHCGRTVYNGPSTNTISVVQSVAFTADRSYAQVYLDYGGSGRLWGGYRFVLRRAEDGWHLMNREQAWES